MKLQVRMLSLLCAWGEKSVHCTEPLRCHSSAGRQDLATAQATGHLIGRKTHCRTAAMDFRRPPYLHLQALGCCRIPSDSVLAEERLTWSLCERSQKLSQIPRSKVPRAALDVVSPGLSKSTSLRRTAARRPEEAPGPPGPGDSAEQADSSARRCGRRRLANCETSGEFMPKPHDQLWEKPVCQLGVP